MAREIKGWRWFSSSLSVGIVHVEDDHEGTLYYIGAALGNDEMADVQSIADWGAKFPEKAGDVLFGVTRK